MRKLFCLPIILFSLMSLATSLSAEHSSRCSPPYEPDKRINFNFCKKCSDEICCNDCPPPCNSCKECKICPPCEECSCCTDTVKIGEPKHCAYNAPARIDPACGWDAWISLSFLYWQPKEKGLDLGHDRTSFSSVGQFFSDDVINMEFDFHPAFKIGVGMSFCRDDWTIFLEYTRFDSKDSKSYALGNKFMSTHYLDTQWISKTIQDHVNTFGNGFSALKAHWMLTTNILDLELGRPFYLGQKLIFKPYFGLRGGTIDQKYLLSAKNTNLTTLSSFFVHSKNRSESWIVGPRAGIDTNWNLNCYYRLFGNISGSLFYQKFKISDDENFPVQQGVSATDVYTSKGKNSVSYLNPNIEFQLGLGYRAYFCHDQWYFDLAVGYSFNYFWNQNLFRPLSDTLDKNLLPSNGEFSDLMIQGLTITAELDF